MGVVTPIGIRRIEALHYYVHDLERSRCFYTEKLGFAEVGQSGTGLVEGGHQKALVFEVGACRVVCSMPIGTGGRADRYLKKHPDGIGSVVFEVEDAERAFSLLEGRGGTPIHEVQSSTANGATLKTFVIATPFGDTTFRFVDESEKSAHRTKTLPDRELNKI